MRFIWVGVQVKFLGGDLNHLKILNASATLWAKLINDSTD